MQLQRFGLLDMVISSHCTLIFILLSMYPEVLFNQTYSYFQFCLRNCICIAMELCFLRSSSLGSRANALFGRPNRIQAALLSSRLQFSFSVEAPGNDNDNDNTPLAIPYRHTA